MESKTGFIHCMTNLIFLFLNLSTKYRIHQKANLIILFCRKNLRLQINPATLHCGAG